MNVLEVARAWRERLQNMEDTAVREAAARYLKATQTAENRLRGILTSIETSGRQPTVTDLFTEYRLATVKQDLTNQLAAWANGEAPRLRATIDHAVSLSPAVALEMVRARATGLPPAAAASLVRHRPDETRQIIATLTRGSPLRDLLITAAKDRAEQAIQTLVAGVALNRDPRRVAGELGKVIDGGVTRARLITRTEMLRTTREAQRQQWAAGTAVTGWVWWSTLDKTTCMVCWAMHGSRHPLDEPFGGHPACRCSMLPDVRNVPGLPPLRDVEPGDVVFARLPPADQQRILGPGRWRQYQAGDLRLGDVVKYRDDPRWGPTRTTAPLTTPVRPESSLVVDRIKLFATGTPERQAAHQAIKEAASVIDRVLKLPPGNKPTITVGWSERDDGAWYTARDPVLKNTSNMVFTSKLLGAHPSAVFFHEFGHYIDAELIEGNATLPASEAFPRHLSGWANAVADTLHPDIDKILTPDDLDYFMMPAELWARSFAQWIALHSGNEDHIRAVQTMWQEVKRQIGWDPQWEANQFEKIDAEITGLFTRLGWMR